METIKLFPALFLSVGLAPDFAAAEEIIVSATRTPRLAAQTGSAVSIITAEEIEARQYNFVADALRDTAGVSIARNSSIGGVASARIRGAGSGQTLVVVDGVVVNDPSAPQGGFNFANLDVVDIDRIEVLRGPQSLVYGADAIGGVISITTNRRAGVSAFAEGGSFGTVRGGANLSLGDDENFSRLSVSGIHTNGFSRAAVGTEDDGFRSIAASLAGGMKLDETWRGQVNARVSDSRAEIDGFPPPDFSLGDADAVENTQDYAVVGSLAHDAARADGVFTVSFTAIDRNNVDAGFEIFAATGDRLSADYITDIALSERLSLIAGVEVERFSVDVSGVDESASNGAAFALLEARASDTLTVSGGVRRDEYSNFEGATTARVSAAWQVAPEVIFRGSWGQGFRAPTLFELNFDQFGFIPNPNLSPERANGFDVGVELHPIENARLQTTFFYTRVTDQIDFDFAGSGYFNIDETRSRGLEVEAEWQAAEWFCATAHYSLIDAIDVGTRTQLLRQPKHQGGASVILSPVERVSLAASLIVNGDENDFPTSNDSFTRIDLRGSFALTEQIEIFGRVENIGDKTYQDVSGYAEPGRSAYGGVRVRL
ncbi:MAG: TonB-dependent receptor [Marinicaulis sp.]|nr:TonB-dependent receptor [Marinicaulis sp.]